MDSRTGWYPSWIWREVDEDVTSDPSVEFDPMVVRALQVVDVHA